MFIERSNGNISISRQCELLGISQSSVYYTPIINTDDIRLEREIDEIYTESPFFGSRRIKATLAARGFFVGRRKVQSLMKKLGIKAIYPKPQLSRHHPEHKIYPYLLKGMILTEPNQVWSTDITYIRIKNGWIYLVAVIDWYSRFVLSWELSNTLDVEFCLVALKKAFSFGKPNIFNSDQGSQFTSEKFTSELESNDIQISMDGRGRAYDNIFIERLWRSVKYEEVYLNEYITVSDAYTGLAKYFDFYNERRLHQSLKYKSPKQVHFNLFSQSA